MPYKHVWYPELKRRSITRVKTTRSHSNEDAHRDMDDFDVNVEHHNFRVALAHGKYRLAAQLAANIDENVDRGGPMPDAWNPRKVCERQHCPKARTPSKHKAKR